VDYFELFSFYDDAVVSPFTEASAFSFYDDAVIAPVS
jgi:hypothetical protein